MKPAIRSVHVRACRDADAVPLLQLLHDTVRTVNAADYTPEEIAAWLSPSALDLVREQLVRRPGVLLRNLRMQRPVDIECDG